MFASDELIQIETRLYKFAYKLTHNSTEAEDLAQSAMLRALEKKHLFKEGTNLYSWVSKILYNLFVTGYRRKTKFESQYDPEPYLEKQSVSASQDVTMEIRDVQRAMNTLPKKHKHILDMICVKGMPYAQVAEKMDVPIGTVRSRLSRARSSLQDKLNHTPTHNAFMRGAIAANAQPSTIAA
tara:strand:- start:2059 stop:2604 length:546 start_codon:yes stop_codon:yes gene_type:complete